MFRLPLPTDSRGTWAEVSCDNGRYVLTVVEKEALTQVVSMRVVAHWPP